MKKLLLIIITMLGITPGAKADTLLDQFYAGFVGNAKFAIESTTAGVSKPEFLDNFLEIGTLRGDHLFALDAGVGGTILPDSSQFKAAEWTIGGKLHLAPLLKNYVKVPAQWSFLNTLEMDARASYDLTLHHPFYGVVAAYPFK